MSIIIFLNKRREESVIIWNMQFYGSLSGGLHRLVQHHFSYLFERTFPELDWRLFRWSLIIVIGDLAAGARLIVSRLLFELSGKNGLGLVLLLKELFVFDWVLNVIWLFALCWYIGISLLPWWQWLLLFLFLVDTHNFLLYLIFWQRNIGFLMFLHLTFEPFTRLVLIFLILLLEESIFAGSDLFFHRVFSKGLFFIYLDNFRL